MSEFGMSDDKAPMIGGHLVRVALIEGADGRMAISMFGVAKGDALRMVLHACEQLRIEVIKEIIEGPKHIVAVAPKLVTP